MIHLYTGDGKGKTTAALGLVLRAAGRGLNVAFAQFMKGNDTGELYGLAKLSNVEICRSQKNFGFFSAMSEEDKEELTGIHNQILDRLLELAQSGKVQLIVLDEITYPVNWNLVDADRLRKLLEQGCGTEISNCGKSADGTGSNCHNGIEIVMTGRNPAPFLTEAAHYITEMKCIRHPYQQGIRARRGIEF